MTRGREPRGRRGGAGASNERGSRAGARARLSAESDRVRRAVLRAVREASDAGRPLPGEHELMERAGASRTSIRTALAQLEHRGIVHRRQGAPTEVDALALKLSVRLENLVDHADLLGQLGYEPRVEVIEARIVDLTGPAAGQLTHEAAGVALRTVKRWWADDAPAMAAVNTIALPPEADAAAFVADLDATEKLFDTIERLWGERIVWDVASPSVVVLDAESAALMALPEGTPVMGLELVGVGTSGRPLFHAQGLHNPATVHYSLVRSARPPWEAERGSD